MISILLFTFIFRIIRGNFFEEENLNFFNFSSLHLYLLFLLIHSLTLFDIFFMRKTQEQITRKRIITHQ